MKGDASFGRNFLGDVAGVALTCLVIAHPMAYVLKRLLFHRPSDTVMSLVELSIRYPFEFVKAMAVLFIVSILNSGFFFYPSIP